MFNILLAPLAHALQERFPTVHFTLYADDLNLVATCQEDFDGACALVENFLTYVYMDINVSKTKTWTLGRGAPPPQPRLFNSQVCCTTDLIEMFGIAIPLSLTADLAITRMMARKLEALRRADILAELSISWQ
eukprot:2901066-Amphidinium_carterae.1